MSQVRAQSPSSTACGEPWTIPHGHHAWHPPPLQPGQPQGPSWAGSVPAVGAHINPGLIPTGSSSTAAPAPLTAAPAAGHRAGRAEAGPCSTPCTAGPVKDLLPKAPQNNQSIPGTSQQVSTEREKGTPCCTISPGNAVLAVRADRSGKKKENK